MQIQVPVTEQRKAINHFRHKPRGLSCYLLASLAFWLVEARSLCQVNMFQVILPARHKDLGQTQSGGKESPMNRAVTDGLAVTGLWTFNTITIAFVRSPLIEAG